MVIALNGDELPEWVESGLLGVDVMFDEMTYREMEFALKEVIKAEGRLAELREILLGHQPATFHQDFSKDLPRPLELNTGQSQAVFKIISSKDLAVIHGPPGTGKTTTLVEAIALTVSLETQVLVCAPSNAAIDLLVEKLDAKGLNVVRIWH